jgi:Carboxypeptidase regulatory-like domain/Domain of unknown function (DUF4214)
MKANALVYSIAILVLFTGSILLVPASANLSKRAAGRQKVAGRGRALSRNTNGEGTSSQNLTLPNLKRNVAESGSNRYFNVNETVSAAQQDETSAQPQFIPIVGPVSQDKDLRDLPYIPQDVENEEERLMRYPPSTSSVEEKWDPFQPVKQSTQAIAMPTPSATFAGITSAQSACGCLPPDTDGDVGPNHYIQAVNSRFKIIDKTGTQLVAPTTYNSFFSALGPTTPCGNNQNQGDAVVFYDHMANRWIISDFAHPSFPGVSFYQCVGVSKTADPVAGGWWLYAIQVDPSNPTFLGDYPKFGLWPDAYYYSVNLFSNNTTFNGVRVFALPRSAMINGTGAPNAGAVAFTITPANLGDKYSLQPASFRSGSPPPAGQPEYFLAVNSSATAGTVENKVFAWRFHVDFTTPANSTFGTGAAHTEDASITVNNFVDAFTSSGTAIVPQNGTVRLLDTLGDKIMANVVYQKLGAAESLYAVQTVNNNQGGTGPTAIRWYQFDVTGNTIPGTPAQQQTFNNAADGLWRFMPSIAVDGQGNMVVAYAVSSSTTEPAIAYAGRLAGDPPSTLAQGEAVMQAGGGHQTSTSGRWGDYSATSLDPSDNCSFWHTNEYYSATSGAAWNTRIGKFGFAGCSAPTAADVSISGRVVTANGSPLPGVTLRLSGSSSETAVTNAAGLYRFDNVNNGSFYTVTPELANYGFSPANRSFSLVGDRTDAMFTAEPDATASANAIDMNEYFVRQQYLDFLGREPDHDGLVFWAGKLNNCNGDAACLRTTRIDVSAAFFQSQEFYDTGSFVYRLYRGALGRRLSYGEFAADRSQVVGGPNLEASKRAFALAFVARSEFAQRYQQNNGADSFVEALLLTMQQETGVDLSSQRTSLIARYQEGSTATESRALVVRDLIDQQAFAQAVYNASFVEMEYMGYLRRGGERSGYDFWLGVLNDSDRNNYRGMVCSFITSAEYQRRFGSVVTHSNADCGR